uniref:Uncharacterized protein n=1 Tax=Ditylenchus dipsaci TaxID=166011 RepID=A0A915DVX4_9BILA
MVIYLRKLDEKSDNSKHNTHPAIPFDQRFQAVIKKSSPAQLCKIVGAKTEMSEQMSSLVRARDFEIERLSKACESAVRTVAVEDAQNTDQQSYNLAMLNENLDKSALIILTK